MSCFETVQNKLEKQGEQIADVIEMTQDQIDEITTEMEEENMRLKDALRRNEQIRAVTIADGIRTMKNQILRLTRTCAQLEEQKGAIFTASSEITATEVFVKTTRILYNVQRNFSPARMRTISGIYTKLAMAADERSARMNDTFENIADDRVDEAGGGTSVDEIIAGAEESMRMDLDSQLPSMIRNGSIVNEEYDDPLSGIISDFVNSNRK